MAVFCKVTAQIAPEVASVLPGENSQAKLQCLLTRYSEANAGASLPVEFEWSNGGLLASGSLGAITALEKTVKNAMKENLKVACVKLETCKDSQDFPLTTGVSGSLADFGNNDTAIETTYFKPDPELREVNETPNESSQGYCDDSADGEDLGEEYSEDNCNGSPEHKFDKEFKEDTDFTNIVEKYQVRGDINLIASDSSKNKNSELNSLGNNDTSDRESASVKVEVLNATGVRSSKETMTSPVRFQTGRHHYRKITDADFSLKDGLYHCKKCKYTTLKPKLLKEHVHNRHDPEVFRCDKCEKGFRRKSFYNSHMRTFHKPLGLRNCKLCGVNFDGEEEIKEHWKRDHKLMINTKEDPECELESNETDDTMIPLRWKNLYKKKYNYFYCNFCTFTNKKERYMRQHLTRKHQNNNFNCCVCNEVLSSFDLYTDHIKLHTTDESGSEVHACTICGKVYGTEKTFILHMSEYHADTNFISEASNAGTKQSEEYYLLVKDEVTIQAKVLLPGQSVIVDTSEGLAGTNVVVSDEQLVQHLTLAQDDPETASPGSNEHSSTTSPLPAVTEQTNNVHAPKLSGLPSIVGYHGYLQCFCCNFVGKNRRSLNEHIQRRHGAKKFQCLFCPKKFSRKSGLNMHAATHTGKEFICVYCGDMLGNFAAYEKHMQSHWDAEESSELAIADTKELHTVPVSKGIMWESMFESDANDFRCNFCPFTTVLKRFMRQHIVKEHKLFPFQCAVCRTEFPSLTAIANHMVEHASEDIFRDDDKPAFGHEEKNPSVSVCSICGKAYGLKITLIQHMRKCHPTKRYTDGSNSVGKKQDANHTIDSQNTSTAAEYVACYKCNFMGTRKNLNEHIQRRHADKRYACAKCPKRYSTRSQLNEHVKTHTTSSICEICGKILSGKGALKTHIKIMHEGLKRNLTREYQCPDCGVLRQGKASFEAHMNEHKSITPYECDVCGKQFIGKPHLAAHRRLHLQITHRCEVCNKCYTSRSHLTRHEKTHWRQVEAS